MTLTHYLLISKVSALGRYNSENVAVCELIFLPKKSATEFTLLDLLLRQNNVGRNCVYELVKH